MLEKERERTLANLDTVIRDLPPAMAHHTETVEQAAKLIDTLHFALNEAVTDLRCMGGCPSCYYNRATDRHADLAECDKKLYFPVRGCYRWRRDLPSPHI